MTQQESPRKGIKRKKSWRRLLIDHFKGKKNNSLRTLAREVSPHSLDQSQKPRRGLKSWRRQWEKKKKLTQIMSSNSFMNLFVNLTMWLNDQEVTLPNHQGELIMWLNDQELTFNVVNKMRFSFDPESCNTIESIRWDYCEKEVLVKLFNLKELFKDEALKTS